MRRNLMSGVCGHVWCLQPDTYRWNTCDQPSASQDALQSLEESRRENANVPLLLAMAKFRPGVRPVALLFMSAPPTIARMSKERLLLPPTTFLLTWDWFLLVTWAGRKGEWWWGGGWKIMQGFLVKPLPPARSWRVSPGMSVFVD